MIPTRQPHILAFRFVKSLFTCIASFYLSSMKSHHRIEVRFVYIWKYEIDWIYNGNEVFWKIQKIRRKTQPILLGLFAANVILEIQVRLLWWFSTIVQMDRPELMTICVLHSRKIWLVHKCLYKNSDESISLPVVKMQRSFVQRCPHEAKNR